MRLTLEKAGQRNRKRWATDNIAETLDDLCPPNNYENQKSPSILKPVLVGFSVIT